MEASESIISVDATAGNPEVGMIAIQVGDNQFSISDVEHWTEDGLHIFRSTEFDCYAEAESEWTAVERFIETSEDLLQYLDDLIDAGRATEHEVRMFAVLARRFYEIYNAQREAIMKRRFGVLLRSRDVHSARWQRLTTHDNFSQPAHA